MVFKDQTFFIPKRDVLQVRIVKIFVNLERDVFRDEFDEVEPDVALVLRNLDRVHFRGADLCQELEGDQRSDLNKKYKIAITHENKTFI